MIKELPYRSFASQAREARMDYQANCNACHNFGSSHPAGWNVSNCDGSITTIGFKSDHKVTKARATINADEVWSEDF